MELYEKLYELRRASGMSQEELAEQLAPFVRELRI